MTVGALVLVALAGQAQGADSLLTLARELPESALVIEAKAAPLAARESVGEALRAGELEAGRRLAAAYAAAWQDSFLIREVARFSAWPPERRSGKLRADSLRREGIAAIGREGARAALLLWRRALEQARAIPDTALMAALSGNIGAGFLRDGQLDSAQAYGEWAGTMARTVGDRRVEANALVLLAALGEESGDLATAREYHTRALALHERIGDTRGLAAGRHNLGVLAEATGDLEEARRQYETALSINRRDGRHDVAATNLVNLAGLAVRSGEFGRAERLYRDALAAWRARDARADAADALWGLGQLELRRGDYGAAQAILLEALEIYEQTGPVASELAVRRALAGALAARGELQAALDALRNAEDLAAAGADGTGTRAGIMLSRADLAVQLNALSEAERLYGEAQRLYREAGDPDGEAEARHGLGLLLLEQQAYDRATEMFQSSLRAQEAGGHDRPAALSRLALGRVARARGDTALADRYLRRAAAELERVGDPVAFAAALGERAALAMDRGMAASSEATYRDALARLEGRTAPDIRWRLRAGLAGARRAQGATDEAARILRAAVGEAEAAGRSLALPERRAGFLADKWNAYAQLAFIERDRGLPGAAFEVSERLRAREMLELLGLGRIAAPAGSAGELVVREQDLRRRIDELADELEGPARAGPLRGPPPAGENEAVREALLTAQADYSELLIELRERAPRHATLLSRETADWRDVARRLPSGEAFVEYLVADSGSVALVVSSDSLAIVDLRITRHELARLVAFARGTLESPGPATDSLWLGPFRRLHRHLVAPLEEAGLLEGKTRLLLVPHAELHYLPFSALADDRGRVLVQRYELAVTPSATVWLALGDRPRRPRGGGVLALAPMPDALPGSAREVAAIARLAGPDVRVITGSDATEAAFLEAAPGRSVLHFATYGVLNRHNPLFSFIELAPDDAGERRLEVHEVFGLEFTPDLVVLSACQTGLGSGRRADVPPGDDWIGLTRAFLHAGAANVVATLWAVEDVATATLMEEFYRHYVEGADPGRALALAQRALLASRPDMHPFQWAGLVAVGGSSR